MAEDDIDGDGEPDGLYERPLDIITYKTAVVITGPGVMNLAMTAEAAEQTAALLSLRLRNGPKRQATRQPTLTKQPRHPAIL
jgi:hypothetical protein